MTEKELRKKLENEILQEINGEEYWIFVCY